ncbi:MAG: hypothetical protein A2X22_02145 [Bacteroidetes bacterium GWF2_49_14]|nr:MAG: hypothetical protein A2X22_02145 [Bacteroidetes bacterium GWF2_49_14]HBB92182.1 hypothetical protein [Bacteroidales bacterium]
MIRRLTFILLAFLMMVPLCAQEAEKPEIRPVQIYLGIQPGLEVIPFDEYRSAFNINILPLTLEYAIDRHWGIRVHSIWNIQVRPEFPAVISSIGAEISVPYYFPLKNSEEGQRGFYAAAVVIPEYRPLNDYYSLGLAAEAGYAFLFSNRLSIVLAGQAGMTLQKDPDNPYMRIMPYYAPRLSLGFWF